MFVTGFPFSAKYLLISSLLYWCMLCSHSQFGISRFSSLTLVSLHFLSFHRIAALTESQTIFCSTFTRLVHFVYDCSVCSFSSEIVFGVDLSLLETKVMTRKMPNSWAFLRLSHICVLYIYIYILTNGNVLFLCRIPVDFTHHSLLQPPTNNTFICPYQSAVWYAFYAKIFSFSISFNIFLGVFLSFAAGF